MVIVRCKACGAVYNYHKEGCCPRCGAYNRPPKRERVMADGTVQHMTDAAYARKQAYSDQVCFEQKECHEQKECYEHQAQQGYRTSPVAGAHQGGTASPAVPSRPRQNKRRGCLSPVGILIAVGILFSAIMGFMSDDSDSNPTDGMAESLFSIELDGWERDDYWLEAEMDESFTLPDGTLMAVTGVAWSGEDQSYRIYMKASGGAVPDNCDLYLREKSGENLYIAIDYEALAPGTYSFPVGLDDLVPDHVVFGGNAPDGAYYLICVHLEW